ncbi:TrkH family potassium uptake protein [Selenomonadales bacterium OttesenSCG-928-I06]|nr:TrkH family potassium uptake protein [Selenomonadales bacterium OttesenSCG-928-I06]
MNTSFVRGILGRLLIFYSLTMLFPFTLSIYLQDGSSIGLFMAFLLTFISGISLATRGNIDQMDLKIREGYAIIVGIWLLAPLYATLPFLFTGAIPSGIDAWFEAVSGITTTGATILPNIANMTDSVLLWRSITHWLGGMGIVLLYIAILPSIGMNSYHLFRSDILGPATDKIVPRLKDTAKALLGLYMFFTITQAILLVLAGMPILEAINHSFSTIATGGFSTKDASIAYYNNAYIEIITIIFMIISGGSFALYFQASRKGGLARIYKDTELRTYLAIIATCSILISIDLMIRNSANASTAFLDSLFQVSSIITSTGFVSADYETWPNFSKMLLFILMLIGGCTYSTAGGIKILRYIVLFKTSWAELKKMVHPKVVTSITINDKTIDHIMVTTILQFFFLYILTLFVSALIICGISNAELFESLSIAATSLGNIGPGFGIIGPTTTFAELNEGTKFLCTMLMILGRLELITVIVFLRPEFWRSKSSW